MVKTKASASLKITVPLPSEALYPNARNHWKARIAPKKRQRIAAEFSATVEIKAQLGCRPKWKSAEIQATFYLPRKRDPDNLLAWLKASFDGLQDAGVIQNDGGFVHLPPQQVTGKDAKGRREVQLLVSERLSKHQPCPACGFIAS